MERRATKYICLALKSRKSEEQLVDKVSLGFNYVRYNVDERELINRM